MRATRIHLLQMHDIQLFTLRIKISKYLLAAPSNIKGRKQINRSVKKNEKKIAPNETKMPSTYVETKVVNLNIYLSTHTLHGHMQGIIQNGNKI